MPLTPNFVVVQSLSQPSIVTFTDTSTGSDNLVTSRRVYIQLTNSIYLTATGNTNSYSSWSIGNATVDLDLVPRSVAVKVTVQWLSSSNTVLYTKTINVVGFLNHDNIFAYNLGQKIAAASRVLEDATFYDSFIKFNSHISAAERAISFDDIAQAQAVLDRNYNMIINESKFF